jgi:hypothetical protein
MLQNNRRQRILTKVFQRGIIFTMEEISARNIRMPFLADMNRLLVLFDSSGCKEYE